MERGLWEFCSAESESTSSPPQGFQLRPPNPIASLPRPSEQSTSAAFSCPSAGYYTRRRSADPVPVKRRGGSDWLLPFLPSHVGGKQPQLARMDYSFSPSSKRWCCSSNPNSSSSPFVHLLRSGVACCWCRAGNRMALAVLAAAVDCAGWTNCDLRISCYLIQVRVELKTHRFWGFSSNPRAPCQLRP